MLRERREALRRVESSQQPLPSGLFWPPKRRRSEAAARTLSTDGSASAASLSSGAMLQILIVLSAPARNSEAA